MMAVGVAMMAMMAAMAMMVVVVVIVMVVVMAITATMAMMVVMVLGIVKRSCTATIAVGLQLHRHDLQLQKHIDMLDALAAADCSCTNYSCALHVILQWAHSCVASIRCAHCRAAGQRVRSARRRRRTTFCLHGRTSTSWRCGPLQC